MAHGCRDAMKKTRLQQLQVKFPRSYATHIETPPHKFSDEFRSASGKEFFIYRKHQLFEDQIVDGHQYPAWAILKAFVSTMEQEGADRVQLSGSPRRAAGKTLSWLATRYAIGEGNGDIVFLDQDDWSVWIFYIDGCEVERIAHSFDDVLRGSFCD